MSWLRSSPPRGVLTGALISLLYQQQVPIAAGIKVLLSERLQARDAADGQGDA